MFDRTVRVKISVLVWLTLCMQTTAFRVLMNLRTHRNLCKYQNEILIWNSSVHVILWDSPSYLDHLLYNDDLCFGLQKSSSEATKHFLTAPPQNTHKYVYVLKLLYKAHTFWHSALNEAYIDVYISGYSSYLNGICMYTWIFKPGNDSAHHTVDNATHSPQLNISRSLYHSLQVLPIEHLHNNTTHNVL